MAEISFGDKLGEPKEREATYKPKSYSRKLAAMMWVTTACMAITVSCVIGIVIVIFFI
jgi:hypothetical protein